MRFRSFALIPFAAATLMALHCGGTTGQIGNTADGGSPTDASPDVDEDPGPPKVTTASKVDILIVADDSASMGDKSTVLATSLKPFLQGLAASTSDIHLGVVSSSLGTMGGDVCSDTTGSGDGTKNRLAHLVTGGPGGKPLDSAKDGVLRFGPGGTSDLTSFVGDAQALVQGVGQTGCGFEAQLESAYRFLVQPDPWVKIQLDAKNQADLGTDVDFDVIRQRALFLRPDSLLVVLMLTDEDDSTVDPRTLDGQGWAFASNQFPGSTVFRADGRTTTAPRGTSACATNPASPDCASCGLAATCDASDSLCQKIKADPECQKNGGFYGPSDDQLNVRFHRMKERFGVDPQFPVSRYVDGFSRVKVPDRKHEHLETQENGRRKIGPYGAEAPNCRNPIFAASLPTKAGDELCDLPRGLRSPELVLFAHLGGLPPELASQSSPDWTKILGADPDAFNAAGIDPHMIASTAPRPGLPPPSTTRGDNGSDPVHGREWDTKKDDLQYACTFTLPQARSCTAQDSSCDCARPESNPPLCGAQQGQQLKAKAYPTLRELRVAKGLGERGVIGSVCGVDANGYGAFIGQLQQRIGKRLK